MWTSEFSGDVSKYQSQLTQINERVQAGTAPREELMGVVAKIMDANRQLQNRLENAEKKLESQTDQIANYLTEARTDGLTGLFNRRAFDKATDDLFSAWQKSEQPFTLGLIDIDHFKSINDTYGHPAGDAVLQHIASRLQSELSDSICVARYGGEEFAVLTLASLDEAASMMDQLRSSVAKIEVEHDGQIINVTLSGGVSRIGPDDKIGLLVRRADEALYASKLGGRNRIHLHDGSMCRLVTKVAPAPAVVASAVVEETPKLAGEHEQAANRIQDRLKRIVEEESQRVVER